MHLSSSVKLQTIAGKDFIFLKKGNSMDMTRVVSLNNSAAWLWHQLQGKEFTFDEALRMLEQHFEGDQTTMMNSLQKWIDELKGFEFLEE